MAACVDSAAAKLASAPVRDSQTTCGMRIFRPLSLGAVCDNGLSKACLAMQASVAGLPHPDMPRSGLFAMQETGLTLETASEYLCLATRLSRDHPSIQPLLDAGRRRLRASFGNLDTVWEEADGRRQFAGLPLEAVQVHANLHMRFVQGIGWCSSHTNPLLLSSGYWILCVQWQTSGTRGW